MAVKRLEIYVDSYRTRPFIKDFDDCIDLSPADEAVLEEWIAVQSGRRVAIGENIRIEDVKHHFLETMESLIHSTCVRVSIVD